MDGSVTKVFATIIEIPTCGERFNDQFLLWVSLYTQKRVFVCSFSFILLFLLVVALSSCCLGICFEIHLYSVVEANCFSCLLSPPLALDASVWVEIKRNVTRSASLHVEQTHEGIETTESLSQPKCNMTTKIFTRLKFPSYVWQILFWRFSLLPRQKKLSEFRRCRRCRR